MNWSGHLATPDLPAAHAPMRLQTIEPRRLYRQIADQLRQLVERGELPPGTRLPAERELAAQLGVSRPSVREALIALEVEGLVEVRMGSGVYVRDAGGPGRSPPVQAEPPLETLRARELIECEVAARAATVISPVQLRALRDAIRGMADDVARGRLPTEGDRRFHLALVEALANPVLTRVVADLYDERHNPLFAQLGSHFEDLATWTLAIAEHEAVLDAIAAGDAAAARAAMSRHLIRSHDRFTESFGSAADDPAGRGREPRHPEETTP